VAAAGAWICDSDAFSARLVRGVFTDSTRDVIVPLRPTPEQWNPNSITATWIGHATVLVNFYGTTILTDPVFFDRVGADIGFGTIGRKRLIAPALSVKELPPIDLVLLSHAHMDHLDMPSLHALPKRSAVVTAKKTEDIVAECRFREVTPLGWGQSTRVKTSGGELEVAAFEVKHWGARWRTDSYRGYNGYILKKDGKEVLFGGDTAYSPTFKGLATKPELAIMPIGSYGSKSGNHCTPEESIQMSNECRAKYVLPIHHKTFPIGREPLEEPMERFQTGIEAERIALKEVGETWQMPG
jgi:L-ascorbate metabolism protein UlaG (beta-lactamase superfamily)